MKHETIKKYVTGMSELTLEEIVWWYNATPFRLHTPSVSLPKFSRHDEKSTLWN